MRRFNLTLIALLILICSSQLIKSQTRYEPADAIYFGGDIITIEDSSPHAEAVAVKDGKIIAVGKKHDVFKHKVNATVLYDLEGKTLMPGLIDNHLHHSLGGILLSFDWIMAEEWVLPDRHIYPTIGREDYIAGMIKLEKSKSDPAEWLNVFGYASYFHGKITRADLDSISSTRPIALWQRSFHETILNSKALEILGFTKENTVNPQINFEEGHFEEAGQQMILLPKIIPVVGTADKIRKGLIEESIGLHSAGVTACVDPLGVLGLNAEQDKIAREIHDGKNVPYRTYIALDARMFVPQFDETKWLYTIKNAEKMSGEKIVFLNTDAKTFCDGGFFSQLMQVKEPYSDGHAGQWIYDPAILFNAAKLYYDNGISNHIHVNGDLGIDSLLAMYGRITGGGKISGSRVVFDHVGLSDPDQIAKMKEMGIMASVNPYYLTALGDIYGKTGLGPERAHYISRVGSLVRSGIITALHSDYTMAPAQPLFLAWCAVNRIGSSGKVLGPEERVTVEEALKLITINEAKQYALDNEIGSIKEGKKADFVILESNPLKIDPIKLKDIKILATVFEGTYFKVENPKNSGVDIELWKHNEENRRLAVIKYTSSDPHAKHQYLELAYGSACMCSTLGNIAMIMHGMR
ncbi:MAG: amidohydrolase family protein [Ignavibacteria bacterium]